DADPVAVDEALGADPALADLVRARPGLRVPGSADGFETAVRAVIGQQISVSGARTVLGALVAAAGAGLASPSAESEDAEAGGALTHVFPAPEAVVELAARRPAAFAMPATRRRALVGLAEAVAEGHVTIDPGAAPEELAAQLLTIPGIGPWTATYVTLRAVGDTDAFLAGDLGTRRAAARLGLPDQPGQLEAVSARWRPWRAYAQMHLWSMAPAGTPAARPEDRIEAIEGTRQSTQGESAA
ncbi:MAG TPA: AlkA N-terminal domain-containing protein, partial [Acidimicrobiales bacterium]|nr:AlkA N-terminal domain-containing protein [Acidimicrobiales bacterium]